MTPDLLASTYAVPDLVTFVAAGMMILLGALGVITARNPVHSALSLVLTLFGVAVLFVEQHADFLAAVQVIVYAGAIVVLFLFVIMFLGVDREEDIDAEPLRGQRTMAVLLVGISLAGVLTLIVLGHWVTGAHAVAGGNGGVEVKDIGRSVFTTYLYAFEATAGLLVIAVVGAVVLARRPSDPALDDDEQAALDGAEGLGGDGGAGAVEVIEVVDVTEVVEVDEAGRPVGAAVVAEVDEVVEVVVTPSSDEAEVGR